MNFRQEVLVADPDEKQTKGKHALTTFRLAANHAFKAKTGTLEQRVCFVDVVTWGTLADTCARYLQKGKLVFIEGRLEMSSWEKDDKAYSKLQVNATSVLFFSPPSTSSEDEPGIEPIFNRLGEVSRADGDTDAASAEEMPDG